MKLAVAFLPPPVDATSVVPPPQVIPVDDNNDDEGCIVLKWLELVPKIAHNETPSLSMTAPSSSGQISTTSTTPTLSNNSNSNLTHDNGQIDPEDFYIARVGRYPSFLLSSLSVCNVS